jgi:hypothetical protein
MKEKKKLHVAQETDGQRLLGSFFRQAPVIVVLAMVVMAVTVCVYTCK